MSPPSLPCSLLNPLDSSDALEEQVPHSLLCPIIGEPHMVPSLDRLRMRTLPLLPTRFDQ